MFWPCILYCKILLFFKSSPAFLIFYFLQKIQQSLGHRLPLDSYLLKPIQRITQYQLLLKVDQQISNIHIFILNIFFFKTTKKEMIKYTRDEQERSHLQEALRVMLNILSSLNDVMHSTQIIGYSVCCLFFSCTKLIEK